MGIFYRSVIRHAAFRLSPERSHGLAVAAFRVTPYWKIAGRLSGASTSGVEVNVAGLHFPNPVGLAAGFDKDCRALGGLLAAGFGYVVGGTVTLQHRPGNARPRLVRTPRDKALLNALGFPGKGLEAAERQLQRLSDSDRRRVILSVSGTEMEDIVECHRRLEPFAAGIEVNISSPNTAGLAVFQEPKALSELITAVRADAKKPLFIKMPRLQENEAALELALGASESGADGLVVANTLPVSDARLAPGRGGLSGRPLLESTASTVEFLRERLPEQVTLIASGGIATADDVIRLMDLGASAVQLYTSMVYEGPTIAAEIARGLVKRGFGTA
jgi:dihydroorotate dehydrogenase